MRRRVYGLDRYDLTLADLRKVMGMVVRVTVHLHPVPTKEPSRRAIEDRF